MLEGHCLCRAVTLKVGHHADGASICHCTLCRRWTGLALAVFRAPPDQVAVSGPVRTYRSSSFAERAWCEHCGTHLWFRDDGADYELMPGIFEAARDLALIREIYIDKAFACAHFAGDHPRKTAAEYEADHPHVPG